jgi:hypothetical protein
VGLRYHETEGEGRREKGEEEVVVVVVVAEELFNQGRRTRISLYGKPIAF